MARVALVLLVVAGLLVALSLVTRYGAGAPEVARPGTTHVAAWKAAVRLFDVTSEANVPSWFSSLWLAGGALSAGLIATLVRQADGRDAGHCAALAAVLSLLSLDDVAAALRLLRLRPVPGEYQRATGALDAGDMAAAHGRLARRRSPAGGT